MIYGTENEIEVPSIDILTLLFDSEHAATTENTALHADACDPNSVLTKADVRSAFGSIAYFLRHEYGIGASGPGKDVVVSLSCGQSAVPCIYYGIVAADGIHSPASCAGTPKDIARQVEDGPAKVLICSEDLLDKTLQAAKLTGLSESNVLILKSRPSISLESVDGTRRCDFAKHLRWTKRTDPVELANIPICLLYSSGTTGLPKGVRLSNKNLVNATYTGPSLSRPMVQAMLIPGRGYSKRTLAHLPVAHIAGVQSYLHAACYEGSTVYWMPYFNLEEFIHYVPEIGITSMFSVPAIWAMVAKHPEVKDAFARVKGGAGGAAPFSKEVQESAINKMGPQASIVQVYGLSETTGSITYTRPGRTDAIGSLGALMPNTTMRLVDDDGNDVKPGEPGEALVKGPLVSMGYHNNPEANKNAYTHDGWFCTGDILRIKGDLLYIVDRKKELIKYKGMQVAPAELEGVLLAHRSIIDAAVIGVPWKGTEAPRAYVVLSAAARGKVTARQIINYVKSEVASYKQLRGGVKFVDSVPRNVTGKILRKDLREMQKLEERQSKL